MQYSFCRIWTQRNNKSLKKRILREFEDDEVADDDIIELVVSSTKKIFTKCVTVFDKPVLQISPEELGEKVTSIMERVNRTLECFSVGKRSIVNVPVGSSILRRTLLLLVQHRGRLLLDVCPRELYFLGEVAQDMESYLEEQPLYAPRRKGEVGDFVESLWRSITG